MMFVYGERLCVRYGDAAMTTYFGRHRRSQPFVP